MIVIDAHLDLSWSALNWNRDLTLTVPEIRRTEMGMKESHRGKNTVSFPEMRKGEVAVCLATSLARSSGLTEPASCSTNWCHARPFPASQIRKPLKYSAGSIRAVAR